MGEGGGGVGRLAEVAESRWRGIQSVWRGRSVRQSDTAVSPTDSEWSGKDPSHHSGTAERMVYSTQVPTVVGVSFFLKAEGVPPPGSAPA